MTESATLCYGARCPQCGQPLVLWGAGDTAPPPTATGVLRYWLECGRCRAMTGLLPQDFTLVAHEGEPAAHADATPPSALTPPPPALQTSS